MEAFLREFLPRILPTDCSFNIHAFQGKRNLLDRLQTRLQGYIRWMPDDWRIVVIVDRDNDNCQALKQRLEDTASETNLLTRSRASGLTWQVVNRLAIEELEAWYFGDWEAVRNAYPRVSPNVPNQAPYRDPDAIQGGTCEAFERIMKRGGYFREGLRKVEAARAISKCIDPVRNRSISFVLFYNAIIEATA